MAPELDTGIPAATSTSTCIKADIANIVTSLAYLDN